jgi:alpha-amylase/alpha-mannosidase (GH57 family)
MKRYLCIHGHFYQPPRENPWLEAIEMQDSAYPYHDWNERIAAECYDANAASRILDYQGRIASIPNNYAKISFNFGPTLLAWLEDKDPETYKRILAADKESKNLFSGHGSAMAQAYNHIILPLANRRDKDTQVLWGIRDFQHRFKRKPEGMWLPETAVDLETLEILAGLGIKFTILAPNQAKQVRTKGRRTWMDVSGSRIDPTMAYIQRLPSGKKINLFFYDGPISRAVAFEGLLRDGVKFAERLLIGYDPDRPHAQLVHIATDGESYGHHHAKGDMALAYALRYIEENNLAQLTNYAEYLKKHPPTHYVEIFENSSWSCVHGVDRWWRDCGCNSGGYPQWNQDWRTPLRNALDWLRDNLAIKYEQTAGRVLKDPWAARNDYINIILDRSAENIAGFFKKHANRPPDAEKVSTVLKLLEMQRHLMLMYTSCGWFFDELSGIETVQVLQYAGRAVQLAQDVLGDETVEPEFLHRLEAARSNIPEHKNGRHLYEKTVKGTMVDLLKMGAHYAVSSLFEEYPAQTRIFAYSVDREAYQVHESGRLRLGLGRARFTSETTRESATLSFGVLHFGDHNLNCGVREFRGPEAYAAMVREATDIFKRADIPETIRCLDRHFGASVYSLKSLFYDERRKVLDMIMESTVLEAEAMYRQIYNQQAPLMRFLKSMDGAPLPRAFLNAADFLLNYHLRKAFEEQRFDAAPALLEDANLWQVGLDAAGLGFALKQTMARLALNLRSRPDSIETLERLSEAAGMAAALPFDVDIRQVQNIYFTMLQTAYPEWRRLADQGEGIAQCWVDLFQSMGEKLAVCVEHCIPATAADDTVIRLASHEN